MKKFYAVVAAVLLGFCLFGAAGCSGPGGRVRRHRVFSGTAGFPGGDRPV